MVKNRRSEMEIIAEILTLSLDGSKTTELLYQGNLSYTQLKNYLPFLLENNILEEGFQVNNGYTSKSYHVTEKGLNLLEDIKKVLVHFDKNI
jgi:predicted transcriptional regulator